MNLDQLLTQLQEGAEVGAKALLGWKLVHETPQGRTAGIIVETEAYTQDDPASHTYKGRTSRNSSMYEQAGTIYVYFTYGMHYCVNVVTGPVDQGEAVLIRALEPIEGLDIMQQRRGKEINLTNGPAKLVQELAITAENNGKLIERGTLHLEEGYVPTEISMSQRIGIRHGSEYLRRFYITDNPYISVTKH